MGKEPSEAKSELLSEGKGNQSGNGNHANGAIAKLKRESIANM